MPGLSIGRVVHYQPDHLLHDLGVAPVSGRVSRVDDAKEGVVTLHLDVPPPTEYSHPKRLMWGDEAKCSPEGARWCAVAVVTRVPFDADGAPGTWRFPPKV
jgi:hypothetical protein